jgi:hypothetical protein
MNTKVCTECQEKFPATSEYFHKQKRGKFGIRPECKKCRQNRSKLEKINKNQYNKQYYKKNKIKLLSQNKIYYQINKEKIQKQKTQYQYNKLKTDPYFRMIHNIRRRINAALHGNNKSKNTLSLIGCEIVEFKKYIENQFVKNMSWDNYGKWHIDHIMPCSSFDLTDPEQQRKCFHYTNLQPLWAEDNLRKSDKIL